MQYEESLKYYRDLKNSLDTAREEGKLEGKEEGREEGRNHERVEIAKKLKKLGMSPDEIHEITGLSREDIKRL